MPSNNDDAASVSSSSSTGSRFLPRFLKRTNSNGMPSDDESVSSSGSSQFLPRSFQTTPTPPPVPKYQEGNRMLMPSPLPSPVSSNRKSFVPKQPTMRHSDSDSQSESDVAQAQREEAHMKRLVHMAKQQQSLMTAWFAASSGRNVTALPPRRPSSKRMSLSQRASSGPIDVDSVLDASSTSQSKQSRPTSAPVDVDTLSEQSVASQSSATSNESRKSFFQRVFPVTPSIASSAESEGSKTIKMSNVSDLEQGISVDGENENANKSPLRRRVIIASLFCILIVAVLTVVVSVIVSGRDNGDGDSFSTGEGRDHDYFFPTNAPSVYYAASTESSSYPSGIPSQNPSSVPSESPSSFPSLQPTALPSATPSAAPSTSPTNSPAPSMSPTQSPTTIFSTAEFDSLISMTGEQLLEQYGHSVAVSGDGTVIAVGAPNYSHQATLSKSGRVQVFERLPRRWVPRGQVLLGRNELDQFGYAVSLNEDGSRLAVSEPGFDGPAGDRAGNVRVYDFDGSSTWILAGNEIGGEDVADLFGLSLALSDNGKRLAVGSPYHDSNDVNLSGRVRVFEYKDKSWNTVGEALDGVESLDWFGWAVDLSSDGMEVAVGAPRNGGFVRCFQWDKGAWKQKGSDIINNVGDSIELDDRFGMAVSLSSDGKRVAVGSPWKDADSRIRKSGLVAVYELTGNNWNLMGDVFAGESPNARLGWSLSLSDDNLAIGSPGSNQVTLHRWTGSYWDSVSTPIQGDQLRDDYGHAVSLSSDGSIVAVGATESSQGGTGYARALEQRINQV